MIITRTPYRVSLFGGGTDHPNWYHENGGAVLSFAIDKYCYITLRELPPFFEHNFRIVYSKVETVKEVEQIEHPAVRVGFQKYAPGYALEIQHHGDLPSRSGVGSSSAFAVGLINSLTQLTGRKLSSHELANEAIFFEQKDLNETVGSQDQIACSLGGMNFIEFGRGDKWSSEKISPSNSYLEELENRVVLIFSGISRLSSDVSKALLQDIDSKRDFMTRTRDLASECRDLIVNERSLKEIGPMLLESWALKKSMNSTSVTPVLAEFFEKGLKAGAEGGKILGAGGGGFFLFWVDPEIRELFIQRMHPAVHVPIRVSTEGTTRII